MSLNSLNLTTDDLTRLYKNSLVEAGDEKAVAKDQLTTAYKFLGENRKQTLVVVNYNQTVHLPDSQLTFLTKLLAACQLSLGDVAILNYAKAGLPALENIVSFFTPVNVLLFDVKPDAFGLPLIFPQFQIQNYREIKFVHFPSLELIEPDKNLKTQLWTSLKKMYNL